jgi:hypothetical protein
MMRRMEFRTILRGAALPAVIVVVLLAALIAVVVLSGSVGDDDLPPAAPPIVTPEPSPYTAVDVKQRAGDEFTIVRQTISGTSEEQLTLQGDVTIERLTLIGAEDVEPGDWLTVIGIPDPVKNFSVHSLVLIPGGGTPAEDGVARTAAGFAGHEVARDPRDRPVVGGTVLRVEDGKIFLQGPTGEITVSAGPEAPARLYRVETSSIADIGEGDRLAAEFGSGDLGAVLVLPGGATG